MLNSIRNAVHAFLSGTASAHCSLDCDVDASTMLTVDGGLVTVLDCDGAATLSSKAERESHRTGLANVIGKLCGEGRHKISITFDSNPAAGKDDVVNLLGPVEREFKQRGYRSLDPIQHEISHLSRCCTRRTVTIALHTRALPEKGADAAGPTSQTLHEMDLTEAAASLRNQHNAAVKLLVYQLNLSNVQARVMTVQGACKRLRLMLTGKSADRGWRPALKEDGLAPRILYDAGSREGHCVLTERLGVQILDESVECLSVPRGIVRVGGRLACQRQLRRFPDRDFEFDALDKQVGADVAWRISWHIDAASPLLPTINKALAMLGAFSHSNRLIRDSLDKMRDEALVSNEQSVAMRVFVTTFGATAAELERSTEAVDHALSQQGNMVASVGTNDPAGEFIESMAGVKDRVRGVQALPPAKATISQLPFCYTGKGWVSGGWVLRSMEGAAFPIDIGGGGTAAANIVIMGLPGNGKSVTLATALAAAMVKPGRSRLPFIGIIDCGGKVAKATSAGLINYGRLLVGKELQSQLHSLELRRDGNIRINPFDIAFGTRRATAAGQAGLTTLLSRLCTPAGQDHPPMMLPELISAAVAATYTRLASDMNATKYLPGVEVSVDAALTDAGIQADEDSLWWEVRDLLWDAGRVSEAHCAHLRAVPTLTELAQTVTLDQAIERQYGDILVNGMSLPRFVADRVYEAISLYPFLSGSSNRDVSSARVISFDLMDVMTGSGAAEVKLADLAALLARNMIMQTSGMDAEVVALSDPQYIQYNEARLQERQHDEGYLVWDELHKTSSGAIMKQAVEQTQAMGRKDGMNTLLSSQTDVHFTDSMKDLASMAVVCGSISAASAERLGKVLGLTEEAIRSLSSGVLQPPSAEGSSLLLWWRSDETPREALLKNTRSATLLWQLTSKRTDDLMRSALAQQVGMAKAGKLLAKAFPTGGCSSDVEAIMVETGCSLEQAIQRQVSIILGIRVSAVT